MANDTAIARIKERFHYDAFDSQKNDLDAYLFGFEKRCTAKGLLDDIPGRLARKDLLLAYIGIDPLKALRFHFTPRDPASKTYEDVKAALVKLYRPTITIFAARMQFCAATRKDGESVIMFANRLQELSIFCSYADALDERLRDQFAAGIKYEKFQVEAHQRYPDGLVTEGDDVSGPVAFSKLVQLAQRMEQAEAEIGKSNTTEATVGRIIRNGPQKSVTQQKTTECQYCGRAPHDRRQCPARDKYCDNCRLKGHYAAVCRKPGASRFRDDDRSEDGHRQRHDRDDDRRNERPCQCDSRESSHKRQAVNHVYAALSDTDSDQESID